MSFGFSAHFGHLLFDFGVVAFLHLRGLQHHGASIIGNVFLIGFADEVGGNRDFLSVDSDVSVRDELVGLLNRVSEVFSLHNGFQSSF
jgi:hypothetical protein